MEIVERLWLMANFRFLLICGLGLMMRAKLIINLWGVSKLKRFSMKVSFLEILKKISECDTKRALEISSFYEDLGSSIDQVANTIKEGGFSIYVVGNRTVKSVQLRTDQFIAERFEKNGFKHLFTYKRAIHQ